MDPHSDPPSSEAEPPRAAQPLERIRRSPLTPKLAFESVLIVLSVLFGLALNEWREESEERALARTARENFRREITFNLGELTRRQPAHSALAERLTAAAARPVAGRSAFDTFRAEMSTGGLDNAPLRDVAWQTATSTGALRLLPYDQAALVAQTYLAQRSIDGTTHVLADRFATPQNYDPAVAASVLRMYAQLVADMSGQEEYVIEVYREALAKLPTARE